MTFLPLVICIPWELPRSVAFRLVQEVPTERFVAFVVLLEARVPAGDVAKEEKRVMVVHRR